MTEIPELTPFADLAEGRLDPAGARAVADRLASGDPSAVAAREWVSRFLAAAATSSFTEAPPALGKASVSSR